MKPSKDSLQRNYRNFGLTIIAIISLLFIIGAIGHFFHLPNQHITPSYTSGRKTGSVIRWYVDSGLWYGNIFAFFAVMEKRHSFFKGILLSLTGWVYVVYYALTRKTVTLSK